jgi:DNA-binding transcriptional ArsR family regulator
MVNNTSSLDSTFGAIRDPTRRAILSTLMLGQSSISELAKPHRMSLPAVMKHLRVLEHAGLVTQKKSGRTRQCRLSAEPLKNAEQWIARYRMFWENQFAALDRHLAQDQKKEGAPKSPHRIRSRNKKQNPN